MQFLNSLCHLTLSRHIPDQQLRLMDNQSYNTFSLIGNIIECVPVKLLGNRKEALLRLNFLRSISSSRLGPF